MPRNHRTIVCTIVPRFALRVAAGNEGRLADQPLALGPEPGRPSPHRRGQRSRCCPRSPRRHAGGRSDRPLPPAATGNAPTLERWPPPTKSCSAGWNTSARRWNHSHPAPHCLPPTVSHGCITAPCGCCTRSPGRSAPGGRVGAGPGRFIARAAAAKARHRQPFTVGARRRHQLSCPVGRRPTRPRAGAMRAARPRSESPPSAIWRHCLCRRWPTASAGVGSRPGAWHGVRTKLT